MKKQKQQDSKKKDLINSSTSSMNALGANSSKVPIDIILEIHARLPAKSIARFHSVSKGWATMLNRPIFNNLFMKKSSSRPRLIFTFHAEGKWSFFSSPQSLILDETSSLVVVDNHMHVPRDYSFGLCVPVEGLLCSKAIWMFSERKDAPMMICNPSTGKTKSLPKVKTQRSEVITFFGYDPIEELYKVLCMTTSKKPFTFETGQHQVLTLGNGKQKSWRMIECSVSHYPEDRSKEICINGILYYFAKETGHGKHHVIVCFDVRAEKLKFIIDEDFKDLNYPSTLINYHGKLGVIHSNALALMAGNDISFELWIIDDIEKHKWSRHIHILPPLWKNLVEMRTYEIYIAGIVGTSDIVFSPCMFFNPFYIFIYNMERRSIRRVEIQGIGPNKSQKIYTFTNHIENVKSIM